MLANHLYTPRLRTTLTAFALALMAASCSKPKTDAAAGGGGPPSTGASAPGATPGSGPLAGATLSMLTSGFEGEIDGFMQKAGAPPKPVSLLLKGDKVRFEIPEEISQRAGQFLGEKAYGIFDSAGKKLYVISDSKKQAVLIDMNSGKPMGFGPPGVHAPGAPTGAASGTPSKIVKTGKYETVAGYKCEDWDVVSDHKEGTICVADQGVTWLSVSASIFPSERAYMAELVDGKHLPLQFVSYQKDGTTEESRVEVTKIDKKSLEDSQFQVPPGYSVLDLEKMFAGMQGMPGMRPGMMPPGMPPGMMPGTMPRRAH